jgi:EKC/KEOPS complex subunit CGI121/TPRKB
MYVPIKRAVCMIMMETYTHPQFPSHVSVAHVALYTTVENASLLRARIIKAATIPGVEGDLERDTVNFAFVNAHLVSPIKA